MKYCAEMIAEICGHISNGLSIKDSCTLSDIGERTFHEWMHDEDKDAFRAAVKKAECGFKERHLRIIDKAAERTWQAAAWLMERKYSEEFAIKTKQELSGYIERAESEAEVKNRMIRMREWLNKIPLTKSEQKEKELVPA